jgi:hypothetical protein
MSGGEFDYIQYRIGEAADMVEQYILRCDSPVTDKYGYKPEYSSETMLKFRECELTLRRAAAMLQRMDWLVSGDDAEESFHRRWAEDVPAEKKEEEGGE